MPPTAAPIVVVAILPTMVAAIIVFVASSLSAGDISAPRFPKAKSNCLGLSKIAESISAGDARSSKASATSAVIMTALPFSSVRTSTGVSAGRSAKSRPALISADTGTAGASINCATIASATIALSSSVNLPSAFAESTIDATSLAVTCPSARMFSNTSEGLSDGAGDGSSTGNGGSTGNGSGSGATSGGSTGSGEGSGCGSGAGVGSGSLGTGSGEGSGMGVSSGVGEGSGDGIGSGSIAGGGSGIAIGVGSIAGGGVGDGKGVGAGVDCEGSWVG